MLQSPNVAGFSSSSITRVILQGVNLEELRIEYTQRTLNESDVDPDPIRQFETWLEEAIQAGLREPTAMALATATPDGVPSCRMVLLKGVDCLGFRFYTNYESRKGRELALNPHAALVFYWAELERQVRVTGQVAKLSRQESDAYFQSRPLRSRLAALASRQSQPLSNREELERRMAELEQRYGRGGLVPLPENWGGYCLKPNSIEFWQGRRSRLHDRILYTLSDEGKWKITRLSP
ncbi:MAG: pyridoxamine 5'-phosphate oxidase [Bryobacteraceae bacterium]|nr:pyridoxamine 5'-phosphate oxidase [Bryobacteraceae bacterium]MDW8377671.1 pyridoxamine 5'-phosphate oxidase [Bryobacterales bacterium]